MGNSLLLRAQIRGGLPLHWFMGCDWCCNLQKCSFEKDSKVRCCLHRCLPTLAHWFGQCIMAKAWCWCRTQKELRPVWSVFLSLCNSNSDWLLGCSGGTHPANWLRNLKNWRYFIQFGEYWTWVATLQTDLIDTKKNNLRKWNKRCKRNASVY